MKIKFVLLIAGTVLAIIFVILLALRTFSSKSNTRQITDTNSPYITQAPTITRVAVPQTQLLTLQDVPQFASGSGSRGIDVASEEVQNSIFEIQKLDPYLPYESTFQTSDGKSVQIIIPQRQYQDNDRTLLVNVYYIDFNLQPGSQEDLENKFAFKETVDNVTLWMQQQGVDPTKIIFKWGDTAEVQKKAEEWLAN